MKKENTLKELYDITENDYKNLGKSAIPTEIELEAFEKWKKKKRKELLFACIYSLLILIVIGIVLISSDSINTSKNLISFIITYIVFLWVISIIFKRYLQSRYWKIEYCNYGIVVEKNIFPGRSNEKNIM